MRLYVIKDWDDIYENNRTRTMKRMQWVPIPNRHDGDGFTTLVSHENGAAHLGVWLVVLQLASRSKLRGALLRDEKRVHDEASMSRITRLPTELIAETLTRLSSEDIGWIEKLDIPDDTEDLIEAITLLTPSCNAIDEERNRIEGNGKEGKGIAAVHQGVINRWNEIAKREGLPLVKVLGSKRYNHFRSRLKTFPDFWETVDQEMKLLGAFARGDNDRQWSITFDYCVESENKYIKMSEGFFREREKKQSAYTGPKEPVMRRAWSCVLCDRGNVKSQTHCGHCGKPRTYPWRCKCGKANLLGTEKGDDKCEKCGAARPESVVKK